MGAASVVRFSGFRLDLPRRCLYGQDGAELKLRPKSFDLLCYLIEHRGRVVSKDELVAAVWPDVVVTDDSVFQCIRDVRSVLGDATQQIVRTMSRRGYLFAAHVTVAHDAPPPGLPVSDRALPTPSVTRDELAPALRAGKALARARDGGRATRAAFAIAALLVVLGIVAWTTERQPGPQAGAGLRIAVLPFDPLEPTTERHFGDGLAEDMITALSRFQDLTVLAGNSSFRYRGDSDSAQAGKALDAAFIVRGSVARVQDHVRVNVLLVDAKSGATRYAERYERPLHLVFALQDEIADEVAARLVGKARYHGAERIRTRPPNTLEAYELLLRARQGFDAFTTTSLVDAHALLLRATAIDPAYAPAWDLLGRVRTRQYLHPGEQQFSPQTLQQAPAVTLGIRSIVGSAAKLPADDSISATRMATEVSRAGSQC